VTVVGGGIAGLSAALRLAERGYPVKLYERSARLGGNLGSRPDGGTKLDVYPHMYLNWYHNFWSLLADATRRPEREGFTPGSTIWQLRRGDFPRFRGLTDAYSPWNLRHALENVTSGVGPPADMLVFGYAGVDLLAERLQSTVAVDELSVSAFLRSRPYMTDRAAAAYDNFITMVWSLPSYMTSAADYQAFLEHSVAEPTPAFWLARGPAEDVVIGPLREALTRAGAEIVTGVEATGVSCRLGQVQSLTLKRARFDARAGAFVAEGKRWTEDVEELVLAVTAPGLSRLVRSGPAGERIVELMPQASELSRLEALPIPILYVYFNRRLERIPAEPVGLLSSPLALAFTDVSQTWDGIGERTVLALSCSDPHGLPRTGWQDDAMTMLRELAAYLEFDAGDAWGASDAIDWEHTRYHANEDAQLFVNVIGTDPWRPAVHSQELANLWFAGDFCHNKVGLTTIESAATAGVEVAAQITARHGIGDPVPVHAPGSLPAAMFAWLRVAWGPSVTGAKAWSSGGDALRAVGDRLVAALG
jgi:phytoene dehydrogenase-like protein